MRTSSLFWLLVLGNFETLGSKFSHETVGLLAPYTTIQGSQILFLLQGNDSIRFFGRILRRNNLNHQPMRQTNTRLPHS